MQTPTRNVALSMCSKSAASSLRQSLRICAMKSKEPYVCEHTKSYRSTSMVCRLSLKNAKTDSLSGQENVHEDGSTVAQKRSGHTVSRTNHQDELKAASSCPRITVTPHTSTFLVPNLRLKGSKHHPPSKVRSDTSDHSAPGTRFAGYTERSSIRHRRSSCVMSKADSL